MVTKILKLNDIKAADYNPRRNLKPEDDEYQKLKRSIETFGFVEPLIVNERTMTIVGGHQRYKILRDLGIEETEAVIVNLTPNDERLLNVALNKIESDWDIDKLSDLFKELNLEVLDLTVTGFNATELENFFGNIEEVNFGIKPSPPIKKNQTDKNWLLIMPMIRGEYSSSNWKIHISSLLKKNIMNLLSGSLPIPKSPH